MSVVFEQVLPESTQVIEDSGARLEVKVTGDVGSIGWKHSKVDEEGDYGPEIDVVFDGVRVSQDDTPESGLYAIVFQELCMADDGKYVCIAKDSKGGESRAEGDLVIEPLPDTARKLIQKKEHKV